MGEPSGTRPMLGVDPRQLIKGRSSGKKSTRDPGRESPPFVLRSPLLNEGFDEILVARQVREGVTEVFEKTYHGSYMQAVNINMTHDRVDGEAINFKEVPLPKMAVRMLKLFKSHMIVMQNLKVYPLIEDVGGANKDNVQMYRRAHEVLDMAIYALETTFDPEVYEKCMQEAQTYVDAGKFCEDDAPEFELAPAKDEPAEEEVVAPDPLPKVPRKGERDEDAGPDSGAETETRKETGARKGDLKFKIKKPTGMQAPGAAAGVAGPSHGPWEGQFQPGQELPEEAEMLSREAITSQLKCIWSLAKKNPGKYIVGPAAWKLVPSVLGLSTTWFLLPYVVLSLKGGKKEVGSMLQTVAPPRIGLREAGKAMVRAETMKELEARDAFGGKGPASVLNAPYFEMWRFIKRQGEAFGFDMTKIPEMDAEWEKKQKLQQQINNAGTELSKLAKEQRDNPFKNSLGRGVEESLSGWWTMSDESIEAWATWLKRGTTGIFAAWRIGAALAKYSSWFHGIYTEERFKAFAKVNNEQFLRGWVERLQTDAEKMKEYFKLMYTLDNEQAVLYGPAYVVGNAPGGIIGALNDLHIRRMGLREGRIQSSYDTFNRELGRNKPDTRQKTEIYNNFFRALRGFEAELQAITDNAQMPHHEESRNPRRHAPPDHTNNFALWRARVAWLGLPAQAPLMDFDFPLAQGVPVGPAQPPPAQGRGRGAPVVRGERVNAQGAPGVARPNLRPRGRGRGQAVAVDAHGSVVNHIFFKRYGL